jgi:hypothetical protein
MEIFSGGYDDAYHRVLSPCRDHVWKFQKGPWSSVWGSGLDCKGWLLYPGTDVVHICPRSGHHNHLLQEQLNC